ncbi:MAG: chromosomal replication initiator protein DnaA [Fibrobacterota bacterium]
MDKNTLWTKTIARLKTDISIKDISFSAWIEPLTPLYFNNGILLLRTDNPFGLETLNTQYSRKILETARQVTGEVREVRITLEENVSPPSAPQKGSRGHADDTGLSQKKTRDRERRRLRTPAYAHPVNKNYTFESFIGSDETNFALNAALAVSENPGARRFNPLFIHGDSGCGKTHLLHAAANRLMRERPNLKIILTTADEFYQNFYTALRSKEIERFNKTFTQTDALLIDDIHRFSSRELSQIELFKLFNILHQSNRQMIFTATASPFALKGIEERLLTRFQWGLSVGITAPGSETRSAIILKMAEKADVSLTKDAVSLIAERGPRNTGELEGIIIRFSAHTSIHGGTITAEKAEELLVSSTRGRGTLTGPKVVTALSAEFGVAKKLILGKGRSREVALARQVGMYICKKESNLSLKAIGLEFGGRDHSTVVHAVKNIGKKIEGDPALIDRIDAVIRRARE